MSDRIKKHELSIIRENKITRKRDESGGGSGGQMENWIQTSGEILGAEDSISLRTLPGSIWGTHESRRRVGFSYSPAVSNIFVFKNVVASTITAYSLDVQYAPSVWGDQAGILIYIDDLNWIKLVIEGNRINNVDVILAKSVDGKPDVIGKVANEQLLQEAEIETATAASEATGSSVGVNTGSSVGVVVAPIYTVGLMIDSKTNTFSGKVSKLVCDGGSSTSTSNSSSSSSSGGIDILISGKDGETSFPLPFIGLLRASPALMTNAGGGSSNNNNTATFTNLKFIV